MIAMTLLPAPGQPGADPNRLTEWLLWLDLWALSPRNPGVAAVRREFDERWHQAIRDIVARGQEAGEFAGRGDTAGDGIGPDDFALTLAALLDGLAVRIALKDPDCGPARAYDLAMAYAARQLGFVPQRTPAQSAGRDGERDVAFPGRVGDEVVVSAGRYRERWVRPALLVPAGVGRGNGERGGGLGGTGPRVKRHVGAATPVGAQPAVRPQEEQGRGG
jgi:hypothetical protein